MNADIQMIQRDVKGGWNLSLGEVVLLQKYLTFPDFIPKLPFKYPNIDGDPTLVEELKILYPDHEIVICNGTKQSLLAAFYALREVEKKWGVLCQPPYWASHRTLAELSGLTFIDKQERCLCCDFKQIKLITSPNNPTGEESIENCDIWDSVYTSFLYGWSGKEPKYRIRVAGAAKLLGLSGLRVGWAVTKDKVLAEKMKMYIESTTSGVSALSQQYVAHALKTMRTNDSTVLLRMVRDDMLFNGESVKQHLGKYCEQIKGVPDSGKGMFSFIKIKEEYGQLFKDSLKAAKVSMVTGEACGMVEANWYRINMMQDIEYILQALCAIVDKMEKHDL